MGFGSKREFAPPTILLGLLLCPCAWGYLLTATPAPTVLLGFPSSGPITSWQIDGEIVEIVTDFISECSKITEDVDFSYEIKRRLLL